MKVNGKRSWEAVLALAFGVAMVLSVGCSKKPAECPQGKPGPQTTKSQLPAGDLAQKPPKSTTPESEVKMSVQKESYGKTSDGTEVDQYTLTNDNGMKVKVITYGAMIISVEVPGRDGKLTNVTLCRDSLEDYLASELFPGGRP